MTEPPKNRSTKVFKALLSALLILMLAVALGTAVIKIGSMAIDSETPSLSSSAFDRLSSLITPYWRPLIFVSIFLAAVTGIWAMSRLQIYVAKEVLKAFVPAFLILTLIIVLGFCVQLLREGLNVVRLSGLPKHILSFSFPLVLPSAFLTAVLMAFGRLSADNEIIAIRVGGIHLFSVVLPILVVAVALSALTAYFQFQVVPDARKKTEDLKRDAIKQILIDRVALSAQRQFSFTPCHVLYDDFENGEMVNLLIVWTKGDAPKTVITASRGTIVPDPKRPEFVLLKLKGCSVTHLEADEFGGRGDLTAKDIELPVQVAPDPEEVRQSSKLMLLPDLVKYIRKLREVASRQAITFANPDRKSNEARDKLRSVEIKIADVQQNIDRRTKTLERLRGDDRRELNQRIVLFQAEIQAAKEQIALMKTEQVSYQTEVENLQKEGTQSSANIEHIADLQKRIQEVKGKVDGLNAKIAQAQSEIGRTTTLLKKNETDAGEQEDAIALFQTDLTQLRKQQADLNSQRRIAEIQKEQRDVNIRIHKRLAEAMGVLVFAMLGIPLGIMTRRRSIMVALGISFAIVLLIFYPLLLVGQVLAELNMVPIVPGVWSGDAITFTIGLVLLVNVVRK